MKIFIPILTGFLFLSLPALADAPAKVSQCALDGFVKEKADVFDAPGGKIIGTIPGLFEGAGEYPIPSMAEVEIVESKDGWFKIKNAKDNEALMEGNETPLRKMFTGEGWVKGETLTVKSQSLIGYSAPEASSTPLTTPIERDDSPPVAFDAPESNQLADCKGDWALIDVVPPTEFNMEEYIEVKPAAIIDKETKRLRIWVNKICGLQETTCDGMGE